jgi:hypothetical protein
VGFELISAYSVLAKSQRFYGNDFDKIATLWTKDAHD